MWKFRQTVFGKKEVLATEFGSSVLPNEEKYKKLHGVLSDEKSRKTQVCILQYRVTGDFAILHAESDFAFNQYFDKKIMTFTDSEVFVDCGGFIGYTTEMFISRIRNFLKIYLYEPEPENYAKSAQYLASWEEDVLDKIVLRDAGVGKENILLKISSAGSGSHISLGGEQEVTVVSLDEDINEPISFIKMDIEGFEIDA